MGDGCCKRLPYGAATHPGFDNCRSVGSLKRRSKWKCRYLEFELCAPLKNYAVKASSPSRMASLTSRPCTSLAASALACPPSIVEGLADLPPPGHVAAHFQFGHRPTSPCGISRGARTRHSALASLRMERKSHFDSRAQHTTPDDN